jgi:uncharacterized protein YjbI with pentapeptide repeats
MLTWFAKLPVVEKIGWLVLILVLLGFVFAVFFFGLRKVMGWQKNPEAKDGGKVARQRRIGAAILVTIIIILIILWKVPEWQVAYLENNIEPKDLFDKENEARRTVAQIIGGFALLIGIYLTWRRIAATERNLEIAQDGQITERFTRAIEQLGNEKLEVRMGGIYALERIARDSEKDHWPIMEVLTAYVRENAPWPPEDFVETQKKRPWAKKRPVDELNEERSPAPGKGYLQGGVGIPKLLLVKLMEFPPLDADIQAILTVIGRRARTFEKGEVLPLDLTHTDLRKANLRRARLEGADLRGARLEGAKLDKAHLEGANLWEAHLEGAELRGANLEWAYLSFSHLEWAVLSEAKLKEAIIESSHFLFAIGLEKDQIILTIGWPLAFFNDASLLKELGLPPDHNERLKKKDQSGYNLEGVDLRGAGLREFNLKQANLKGTRLEGAYLFEAHLEGANLEGAEGLTEGQIRQAFIDENTRLPYHLKHLEKSGGTAPEQGDSKKEE